MRTKKNILLSILLATVLAALPVDGGDTKTKIQAPTRITVTDMAGRQVFVTVPVNRVVLWDRDLPTFAAVAGENFLQKIAGWELSVSRHTLSVHDTYFKFWEKYPEIGAIPDVGNHWQGTFNVEKVISLKPDVFIMPLWLLIDKNPVVTEDIARMEAAGIPTVFIDCWKNPFESIMSSTLLLGTLLGKEKRAQEIVDFYQKRVPEIFSRLQKIKKPKPKVYVEGSTNGPSEYGGTCGNVAWGVMVVKAGGVNISEGIIKRFGQISPEYLLKTNPDVIIIAGPEPPSSKRPGNQPNREESRRLLKAFTKRPGWNNLNAVKHGRVYGILDSSYLIHSIYNFAVIQGFAKWFYPDDFRDLDPERDRREFNNKFLPFISNQLWMIGIQD